MPYTDAMMLWGWIEWKFHEISHHRWSLWRELFCWWRTRSCTTDLWCRKHRSSQRDKEPTSTGAEWITINSSGRVHILGTPTNLSCQPPNTLFSGPCWLLKAKWRTFPLCQLPLKGFQQSSWYVHRDWQICKSFNWEFRKWHEESHLFWKCSVMFSFFCFENQTRWTLNCNSLESSNSMLKWFWRTLHFFDISATSYVFANLMAWCYVLSTFIRFILTLVRILFGNVWIL